MSVLGHGKKHEIHKRLRVPFAVTSGRCQDRCASCKNATNVNLQEDFGTTGAHKLS